jgi:hypothetical protein
MKKVGLNKLFYVLSICYFTAFGDLKDLSPAFGRKSGTKQLVSNETGTVERNGFEANVGQIEEAKETKEWRETFLVVSTENFVLRGAVWNKRK